MHRFLSFCLLILTAVTLPAETFRNPYRIPTTSDPSSVIVADFNGDGLPDIVYGENITSPQTLHILLAQPAGGYVPGPTITLPHPGHRRRLPSTLIPTATANRISSCALGMGPDLLRIARYLPW